MLIYQPDVVFVDKPI